MIPDEDYGRRWAEVDRFKKVVEHLVLAMYRNSTLTKDQVIEFVEHYDSEYGPEVIRREFEPDIRTPNRHTADLIKSIGNWPV